jgi:L-lactate dehydrogenase complex protein LldG
MSEMIQNRDKFLNQIANRLGRPRMSTPVTKPNWRINPQNEILKNHSQDELLEVLKEQCNKIHTDIHTTDIKYLPDTLNEVVHRYGGGPIITWKDERFSRWGLDTLFKTNWPNEKVDMSEWDSSLGEKNITLAEKANIGIAISDITLAESGTVVVYSGKDKGRTVSFFPTSFIALVPKSTLVPRMTQAAVKMRELYKRSGRVSTCINFITGPSNSADIELNLVVGVHGPVKASYIIIEDL